MQMILFCSRNRGFADREFAEMVEGQELKRNVFGLNSKSHLESLQFIMQCITEGEICRALSRVFLNMWLKPEQWKLRIWKVSRRRNRLRMVNFDVNFEVSLKKRKCSDCTVVHIIFSEPNDLMTRKISVFNCIIYVLYCIVLYISHNNPNIPINIITNISDEAFSRPGIQCVAEVVGHSRFTWFRKLGYREEDKWVSSCKDIVVSSWNVWAGAAKVNTF